MIRNNSSYQIYINLGHEVKSWLFLTLRLVFLTFPDFSKNFNFSWPGTPNSWLFLIFPDRRHPAKNLYYHRLENLFRIRATLSQFFILLQSEKCLSLFLILEDNQKNWKMKFLQSLQTYSLNWILKLYCQINILLDHFLSSRSLFRDRCCPQSYINIVVHNVHRVHMWVQPLVPYTWG